MVEATGHIAFTDMVKATQEQQGSRRSYARMDDKGAWEREITEDLAAFIAQRDFFYLATANGNGLPYIQHRGGPPGLLKVLDGRTLAFADFSGNKQYITVGNLAENDRAFIFLMDYAHQRRIKLWGRARIVEDDPELLASLADTGYADTARVRAERAIVFRVEQWDVNCPQHIKPRYSPEQIAPVVEELNGKITALEAEIVDLRAKLSQATANAE